MKLAQNQPADSRVSTVSGYQGTWMESKHCGSKLWTRLEKVQIKGKIGETIVDTRVSILFWTYDLDDPSAIFTRFLSDNQKLLPMVMTLKNSNGDDFIEFRKRVFEAIFEQIDANGLVPMGNIVAVQDVICPVAATQEMDTLEREQQAA